VGKTVVLVSCVSQKASRAMPAQDLYVSDWFRKASAYAKRISDEWYILSAKYGLIKPGTFIGPYDETLSLMKTRDRRMWARRVVDELREILEPGDRVVFLAGKMYRRHLTGPIRRIGCAIRVPMEGLRIGEQLSWLRERVE
jgi:hypothetical protein